MVVRKTQKEENRRINELFAIAFELSAEDGPAEEEENGAVHHWAAFEDGTGEMMSTFTVSDFNIQFDGSHCKMGGIGGVATLPQYRRKGGIRGCFKESLPDMYREQYDFSYLYPFSTAYYRKFGYECCVQKMMVSVELAKMGKIDARGRCYLCEPAHPMKKEIQALDRIWEEKYNMMVIHKEEDYQWTDKFAPAEKLEFTYVYADEKQNPKAYTTFKKVDEPDGRNLVCSRICFADREGFTGLMALFKSLAADHIYVKFSLPAKENMEYLFPEWAMGAAGWSIQNAGMVRVVNVESVLRKAKYKGTGSAGIQIQDPYIEENDGLYKVDFKDGAAVSVEKTDGSPDIVLDIPAFSAMISGVCSFENAVDWMSGVTVLKNEKALRQLFYKKPVMIVDYF